MPIKENGLQQYRVLLQMYNCILLFMVLSLNGCDNERNRSLNGFSIQDTISKDTLPPADVAGSFSEKTTLNFDSTEIKLFLEQHPEFTQIKKDLTKFYSTRNYSFAWYEKRGFIEQANILYNRILQLIDHGFKYDAPYLNEYKKIMEDPSGQLMTETELMISSQYLFYAKSMLAGIPENDSRSTAWYIPRKKTEYTKLLNTLLDGQTDEISKAVYPQYYLLLGELKKYSAIEKGMNWQNIKTPKKSLQIKDSSDIIPLIRKNLFLAGDIINGDGGNWYDSALQKGIFKFQERYGLKADGIIGKVLIREMNVPISERITTILLNMERCRWLPNETEREHIIVNIPQFTLYAFNKDSLAFKCKVVVGKETNKTMIFKGDMKYVVFSPYWNVPESIIKKEIVPAMRRNPNYLEDNNMEWNAGKIRQMPGQDNALGVVKFLFPNLFNIYLHDTPSKRLFGEEKRTFSHGCIRIAEPMKMTKFLLRKDTSWNDQKIIDAMYAGKEKFVTLKKTIPVYIVYFTAFVDELGVLNFRNDIYSRDELLKEMLFSKNSK